MSGGNGRGRLAGLGTAAAAVSMATVGIVLIRRRWEELCRPPVDDDEVARRVTDFLRRRFGPKAEDFAIRVGRGRVTLRGDAPTLREIVKLGDEIRSIEGVVGVANLLRLQTRPLTVAQGETPDAGFWLP